MSRYCRDELKLHEPIPNPFIYTCGYPLHAHFSHLAVALLAEFPGLRHLGIPLNS